MGVSVNPGGARGRGIVDPSVQVGKIAGSGGIKEPFSIEQAQGSNRNVSAAAPIESPKPVTPIKEGTTTEKPQAPRPDVARPMAKSDIVDQLLRLQKAPSPDNVQILTTLLQYGLEASGQNFEQVQNLLKGRKSTALIESSVVSLAKGLGTAPKSVEVLSGFLQNPTAMATQLQQLQATMRHFQQVLSWSQGLFESGLMTGLGAVLSEMDDQFRKWSKKGEDRPSLIQLERAQMLQDGKALAAFLAGIHEKLRRSGKEKTPEGKAFLENLGILRDRLAGFTESLLAHEILGTHHPMQHVPGDKFLYFQIPNLLAQNQPPFELMIKKDTKKKNGINPEKTKVVLKCATQDIGEVAIVLDVADKDLWMTVHSDVMQTRQDVLRWVGDLRSRFEALDYRLKGIKTVAQPVDIKRLLLPLINLNSLSRISAEA